jgi:hypothetical protein
LVKLLITISLTLFSFQLFAQRISGIVVDKNTLLPIIHATATTLSQRVSTSVGGLFTIHNIHKGDTITISCVGYQSHKLVYYQPVSDTLRIYLDQNITSLKTVTIMGRRDTKADSIRLRKEFAPVFNQKAPTFKDAFITHSPYKYIPNDYITSTNNMTTLLSINLLSVLDLLNKNKAPVSKLQKTLLKDEEYSYVDRVFSRQKVISITKLSGDSLQTFMDKYRPSSATAKTMTDYEVMLYIKKSYDEFKKPGENRMKK